MAETWYLSDDEAEEIRAVEEKYRRELWLNHGHPIGMLYGDDGEMQCGACPFDFKRAPLAACEQQRLVVQAQVLPRTAIAESTKEQD